jgi:hypothetical protein
MTVVEGPGTVTVRALVEVMLSADVAAGTVLVASGLTVEARAAGAQAHANLTQNQPLALSP